MKRTYEYRLYPRKHEREALDALLEQHREVYNAALEQCRNAYQATGKHQSALSQWPYFRDWRNAFPDLILNASSLQHTLRRLDKAFAAFFRRVKAGPMGSEPSGGETPARAHRTTPGYPRFKGEDRLKSIEYTDGDGCRLEYDDYYDRMVLYVQNVGKIKIKLHRFGLLPSSKIKHVVIKRKATGWYVFLQLECPDPPPAEPNGLPAVGGDMGLLRLLTLSDGTPIDNPRWLRQSLGELRLAQRRLARALKGSQNRKDKRLIVAKLHEHVANLRRDFWHQLTYWLVHTYGLIALEDLNLAFMTHNEHLSLSAHDAGLGLFQTLLCYKAVEAGSHVTFVTPADTSQACSGCSEIVPKDLSVRVHKCPNPNCLLELDRDENAARNILKLALRPFADQQVGRPPGSGGQALTWPVGAGVA
jgi:putative transposase